MKKQYKMRFKVFFLDALFKRRRELGISQEEMAYLLSMSTRGYIKLEHGDCSCGALTLALYLIFLCEDPIRFLEDLRHEFEVALAETA